MACFVKLTSAHSGRTINLNLDLAICVVACKGQPSKSTDILFEGDILYTVRESPSQILACAPLPRV